MTTQLSFWQPRLKAINVASVPQRSPFRYPGGKTWFVPYARKWLLSLPTPPREFIEPFAGGAIIGLTAAMEGLAKHVTLVEIDEGVAAVWETILEGDAEALARRITGFELTPDSVEALLARPPRNREELAFQTIVRNRVNHGGILAPGAGRIRRGENGRGLRSRWYPQTLAKRILQIAAHRERITFIHGDGMAVMQRYLDDREAVFFLDPPYTVAGKRAGRRLYTHHRIDHDRLFALAAQAQGDFLMTYDHCEAVVALAQQHGFDFQLIPMRNTHHARLMELLIGRNLNWLHAGDL